MNNPPLSDFIIPIREAALDWITGVKQNRILNAEAQSAASHSILDPAAELQKLLQEILAAFTDEEGRSVDYRVLQASPAFAEFRECVGRLRNFDPSTLSTREERLAFWINLYNTLIVDGVIALGVKRSIAERWAGIAFLRQAAYLVGGRRMSCDDIEHGILRGNRGHPFFAGRQFRASDPRRAWVVEPPDPRVHFALNCASRSCPPIRVYSAEKLNEQLDMATRNFLANEARVLPGKKEINLSAIFNWFSADFGKREGVINFLLSHLTNEPEREWLRQNRGKVILRTIRYDWRLNGQTAEPRAGKDDPFSIR